MLKIIENAPYGYADGLSYVGCYAGILSKTHAKADKYQGSCKCYLSLIVQLTQFRFLLFILLYCVCVDK